MTRNDNCVIINLADFGDDKLFAYVFASRVIAQGLHEIGHGMFTDRKECDNAVKAHDGGQLLHRCINVFEDIRIENRVISTGIVTGAKQLFKQLLQHVTDKADPHVYQLIDNVPMAIRVKGSNYGIDVMPLVPERFVTVVREGVSCCDGLKATQDAVCAGIWLWQEMRNLPQLNMKKRPEEIECLRWKKAA